jgi:hypothetical protein
MHKEEPYARLGPSSTLDFVRRDGQLAAREVHDIFELDSDGSLAAALADGLSCASTSARRSQLVVALRTAAVRAVRRDAALRMLPLLAPVHYLAPAARRGQLLIAAALCALVSLGVAPHTGCGVACWAAEACGGLYAGFAALLILDGALEAASVTVLCAPWRWLDADDALPPPLLRQLALFALGLASLFVHPYFILLSAIDLLPAIPRCRAILTPLAKAAPPVLAIAALAAALALPASAAARAAGAAAECAAGDAVACAVQALATVAPASAAALAMPRSVAVDPEGAGDGEGHGAGDGVEGAAASHLGSQLGPLVLLGLGALLLQLGVAVLVDALADERGRTSVAREYASEHIRAAFILIFVIRG